MKETSQYVGYADQTPDKSIVPGPRQVLTQLAELTASVEKLGQVSGDLIERLTEVTNPCPETGAEEKDVPSLVPLADAIWTIQMRVDCVTRRLRNCIAGLEL